MRESTKIIERVRKLINTCERIDQLPAARNMIKAALNAGKFGEEVAEYLTDLADDWEDKFYSKEG